MKNWKNKTPLVLRDPNNVEFAIGQSVQWHSIPKGQGVEKRQLRKGSIKRIYPDGFLLILGRHGKTRLDPRSTAIAIDSVQTTRFLHGDKVQHSSKGYGVFIHYDNGRREQCFVSFGDPAIVRQTDAGELVESFDLKFWS